MNDKELFDNVRGLLRKAIASRLKIAKTNYDASFSKQAEVDRLLTNVMSIGYNKGDMDEVLEELCTARHFGDQDNEVVIAAMRKEVLVTEKKLSCEIAAFAKMHEMNQAGATPEATWAQVQSMVILGDDYITTIQL